MFCLCSLQFLGIDVLLIWENRWNHIMLSICLRSNIKNSFYLLTWDETLGAFLCSPLYNPANVCEGHSYKSVNKPPNSKSICWQSWAAEPHLWFSPGLTQFGRHCVGDTSLSRTRVCHSCANPPLPFSSENWLRWKMSVLSDPFPSHVGTECFGEEAGWLEMQRCLLSVTGMAREEPCCPSQHLSVSEHYSNPLAGQRVPSSASCSPGVRACANQRGATTNRKILCLQLSFTPSWFLLMPMTIF